MASSPGWTSPRPRPVDALAQPSQRTAQDQVGHVGDPECQPPEHILVKLGAPPRTLAAVRAEREGLYVPLSPSPCRASIGRSADGAAPSESVP